MRHASALQKIPASTSDRSLSPMEDLIDSLSPVSLVTVVS